MPVASLLDSGDLVLQPVTGLFADTGIERGSGSLTSGIPGSLPSAVTSDLGDTGITGVGTNGLTDLVNDVVNLPGSILDGGLGDSLGHIGTDLSNTVASTVGAVDGLANTVLGSNDALAPVSNLVNGITGNLDHALVSADGGTAGTAGLLDLGGNSGGNLIDAGAGQSDSGEPELARRRCWIPTVMPQPSARSTSDRTDRSVNLGRHRARRRQWCGRGRHSQR